MDKKRKKKLTDGTGIDAQGHGHADGCVGMWTWMCCGWMRMSRKERRKKEKKNLLNWEGWLTDVLRVDVLCVDADE